MLRRPGPPLLLALLGAVALAVTGLLAKLVPVSAARQADESTLDGFLGLNQPHLTAQINSIAHLADPAPYALTALALILVALARRRWRVALVVPALFFATGFTTEHLKTLLASDQAHSWFIDSSIGDASWPSGHATAAMTMALCAVMVSPARLRPTVAAVGAAFAIAVAYAILALGWHLPSDVLGGFLVAGTYVMLAIAALAIVERRRPSAVRHEPTERRADLLPAAALAVVAAGAAAGLAISRPEQLLGYASAHTTFVVGATVIAVLATLLAALLGAGYRGGRPTA